MANLYSVVALAYLFNMVKTLNISLTPEQVAWINAQKAERGFATASDVVRDMIREKQEEKWRRLEKEFEEMSKRDGAAGPGAGGRGRSHLPPGQAQAAQTA